MITETGKARELSDAAVLAEARRIIDSSVFNGSPRLCRFLTWTVQQTLQNGGENIKQYAIGQEVFGRGDDFNPRIDSIVRTEAQRLRRKLHEYYSRDGCSSAVQICYSPGSYVPSFKNRAATEIPSEQVRPAVAVLQFENLTGSSDLDYFCRGITESIQERLATVRGLKVVAAVSSFSVSSQDHLELTASRLGVNTIVQGGIRQAKERVRVHARAVNPAGGAYIWAGTFDRDLNDIFAVEDEIASSVASSLCQRIFDEKRHSTPAAPRIEAYDLYLRGHHLCNELTPEAYDSAIDCFTRAILISPTYAQPYAALAEVYFWQLAFSLRATHDLIEVARHAALQAIHLDENCAEAYVVLGTLSSFFDWNWREAERLFHQGLELRPNYAHAYIQRAFFRLQLGDFEECKKDAKLAAELDPLSPRPYRAEALCSYLRRDYLGALAAVEHALDLGSELRHTLYLAGRVSLQLGQFEKAIEFLLRSLEGSSPALYSGVLIAAYARAGRDQEGQDTLHALHKEAEQSFVSPIAFVHAYAGLSRPDDSLYWLENAAEERYTGLVFLKFDPLFDNLRHEPRFQAVLARMNVPAT